MSEPRQANVENDAEWIPTNQNCTKAARERAETRDEAMTGGREVGRGLTEGWGLTERRGWTVLKTGSFLGLLSRIFGRFWGWDFDGQMEREEGGEEGERGPEL